MPSSATRAPEVELGASSVGRRHALGSSERSRQPRRCGERRPGVSRLPLGGGRADVARSTPRKKATGEPGLRDAGGGTESSQEGGVPRRHDDGAALGKSANCERPRAARPDDAAAGRPRRRSARSGGAEARESAQIVTASAQSAQRRTCSQKSTPRARTAPRRARARPRPGFARRVDRRLQVIPSFDGAGQMG